MIADRLMAVVGRDTSFSTWAALSRNPNVTMSVVRRHLDKPWVWMSLCENSNMSLSFLIQYAPQPVRNWASSMSKNPNVRVSDITTHMDWPWDYAALSENPHITLDFIIRYRWCKWRWEYLSQHVLFQDILSHSNLPWDWKAITLNKSVKLSDISTHLELPWSWVQMSKRSDISIEFIKANLRRPWCWHTISRNSAIGMADILANPTMPWDHIFLADNPNVTFAFIFGYGRCYMPFASRRASIQDVLAHRDYKWSWPDLSQYIPASDIFAHLYLPWVGAAVAKNLTLTTTDVLRRWPTKIFGPFRQFDHAFEFERQQSASRKIQRAWRRCAYDPKFNMCKRIQLRRLYTLN